MEIKEVSSEAITGESLLSMIEENVSKSKKAKKPDNEDISEEEIMEDDEFDVQEVDYDDFEEDDDTNEEDDLSDDDDKKKGKIGKKEILMFVALGVSVVVVGVVIYMMLFAEEGDTFDAVVPMSTQKVASKPVQPIQQVKPIVKQQVKHQNNQIDKNSGEPEPLKPINPNLRQQQVVAQPVQPQPKVQAVEKNMKTMGNEIDEIQKVKQKPEVVKPKTIHFVAKSKEDVGINQFAVIGNKAYLSSDLFEKTDFDVEDKEYSARFNGKTRSFLKVIGKDSVYLPAKQVSDNYTVGK